MRPRAFIAAAILVSFRIGITSVHAQVAAADYDRALNLREQWMYLTVGLADPVTWVDNTSLFYYRKTVNGGFEFVMVDAQNQERRPAFDHAKLAAGLSTATGSTYSALRLPFDSFRFQGPRGPLIAGLGEELDGGKPDSRRRPDRPVVAAGDR